MEEGGQQLPCLSCTTPAPVTHLSQPLLAFPWVLLDVHLNWFHHHLMLMGNENPQRSGQSLSGNSTAQVMQLGFPSVAGYWGFLPQACQLGLSVALRFFFFFFLSPSASKSVLGRFFKMPFRDFSGGPGAKTPSSYTRAWVWSLVGELDPTCCNQKIMHAATKIKIKLKRILCVTTKDPTDHNEDQRSCM